ncbi:MAG: hypothetical protein JXM73_13735, partial [Anaerolineae bacterium]|nr:hypothetical protein [Anaerolineae bacterium]
LGPPGTGKTHTIRAVVNQQATQNHKVLITSKNNKAVDNVLEALEGVDALRVGREEAISAQVRPLMIDHKARDKQREILDRTALVLESLDAAESVWPGIQQILAQMVQQAGDWRLAQARFEREMESLGDWQRAQYGNVARAIEGQLRRFQAAHQQVHEAARQAASHSRGIERWSWLCRLPAVGRVFEGRRARLEARWDESARLYRQALRERGRAAGQIQDTWKAYHHAASASEEALRRKGAVAEEEQVLAEVRATAARIVTRLKEMTARFEDAPSLTGAAESPQALEDSRWPLHRWHEALQGRRDLLHDWHELLQRRRQALYPMLLQMADVVGATCIGIATDARFEDLEFDLMIADEAGQIQVMDLLVPLVRARRAVLVGDHRQLPPVVEHEIAARIEAEESELHTWLYQSLFEHLFDRQNAPAPDSHTIMLDTQYRMPRTIADFISAHFYQGRYRTGRDVPHTDPFFDCSLVFVDTRGERQRRERPAVEPEGIRGYTNDLEAELMADLVLAYRARDVQWGVIVPYKKQAERIRQVLCRRHHAFPQDELNDWVATVDSFQGKERDVILYGFTRSNPRGRVGFMAELRRLNVSLTRARHQLVMFGDSTTLARALDAPFAELMQALLTTVNGLPGGYLDVRDYRRKLDR